VVKAAFARAQQLAGVLATVAVAPQSFSTQWSGLVRVCRMKSMERRNPTRRAAMPSSAKARRWGSRLAAEVKAVMAQQPDADPEDVRRTLICLQSSPLERLNRSLRRGQGFAAFRK
jgi:hypothetical protein